MDLEPSSTENELLESAVNYERPVSEECVITTQPFTLIVGMEYVVASKLTMKVLCEKAGLFLGLVAMLDGNRDVPIWYRADGTADRDLDKFPEQDPFDVIRILRAPDTVYLLRNNLTYEYSSNNCFVSRDAAVKAAVERRLQIVAFREVQDD